MSNLKRSFLMGTAAAGAALVASAFFSILAVHAACTNPSTIPTGFAAPCPVFSLSATTVTQSQTLTLSATPQPGTDYIYTTAYVSNGTTWNPYTLAGNTVYPGYSSTLASLTLSSAQLSSLSLGTHYAVVWDWLWDQTAQCYKGPGLNQCNTGTWRVQSFNLTSSATPTPSPTPYAYSQSSYYTYSQSAYVTQPIAFVQNCANSQSGTGVSCALTASNTAGNTLVVLVDWADTSRAISSLTDTRGNVYTAAAAACADTATNRATRTYYATNIPAGTNTLTVNLSGTAGYTEIFAQEYESLAASAPVDKTACGTGASISETAGPVSTTFANDLLFAGAMDGTVTSPGSGYKFVSTRDGNFAEYRIVSALGSYSAGATQSVADGYAMQLVAFKGASSSYTYSQFAYYAYSQSTYTSYTYSQASYYAYSQASYYAYSQSAYVSGGTPWSGILDPSRAIDWSNAGVKGGISNRTTLCATTQCTALNTPANVTAANINSAITSAPANTVVLLPAGTFSLSSGITFNGKSNVTLRGSGSNSTFLVFSGTVGTGVGDGIEDLSVANNGSQIGSNISFGNARDGWVKNIRSLNGERSHVLLYGALRITIENSYFFGTLNATTRSYGIETDISSSYLVQNVISQHLTSFMTMGQAAEGSVWAYNFSTDSYYCDPTGAPFGWMQGSSYHHTAGIAYTLFEGNVGTGFIADDIHGTSDFMTGFRNRWQGYDPSGCSPSGGKTQQTIAGHVYAYNRYFNFIGNVLGDVRRPHTNYEGFPATPTTAGPDPNADVSIYELGWSGNQAKDSTVPNDPFVRTSMMRWGNYDTVNAANRFASGEVPSGISPYGNSVPANQTLPASFYLSAKPSWWGTMPWPAIGPDVTGGNIANVGGHAYKNPAQVCYESVMGGPLNGASAPNPLSFNPASCY